MLHSTFQELSLSRLGFGAMRLPLGENNEVDLPAVDAMVDYALAHGVNYFDTAWPYHGGQSEVIIGKSLGRHPRESWRLASKYPGHQILSSYDPAAVFEVQLKKCGVDYFDFYLLHNVCENSLATYMDPKWGILPYFLEQKRLGRIKHLGFSTHGRVETIRAFLDWAGDTMEFCQIQLNYLDWTLQQAREKYELLTDRGIPVWVMEPVRGGKLAALPEGIMAELEAAAPGMSAPEWAFRFLMDLPNVQMVLSGMSSLAQMEENVETFREHRPLTEAQTAALLDAAESLKNAVHCTACRYCMDKCPVGLDIPLLISIYNDLKFRQSMMVSMQLEAMPPEKRPDACLGCGACAGSCPQSIDIPGVLKDLARMAAEGPSWAEECRKREEAAKKNG